MQTDLETRVKIAILFTVACASLTAYFMQPNTSSVTTVGFSASAMQGIEINSADAVLYALPIGFCLWRQSAGETCD